MYMLVGATDGSMTGVMPASGMATISSQPTAGDFVRMQSVSSLAGEIVDLGVGDTILGFTTHHYRISSTIAMRALFYGDSCTHTARSVTDSWSSPDADVPSMSGHFMNYFGGTAVDTAKASAAKAILRKQLGGDALKSVTVTRRAAASGDSTTVTSTMEITELAHGEIDLSVFEVPAGLNVIDSRPMTEAMLKQPGFQQTVASTFRKTWCDAVPR